MARHAFENPGGLGAGPQIKKRSQVPFDFQSEKQKAPGSQPGAQGPCHQPTLFRSKSMATDPKKSLTPSAISSVAKTDVDRLLQTGLADFSLRELLSLLISSAGAAERNVYLQDTPADKSNGFYDRSLQVGSIPVDIRVPRTRNGDFRPTS